LQAGLHQSNSHSGADRHSVANAISDSIAVAQRYAFAHSDSERDAHHSHSVAYAVTDSECDTHHSHSVPVSDRDADTVADPIAVAQRYAVAIVVADPFSDGNPYSISISISISHADPDVHRDSHSDAYRDPEPIPQPYSDRTDLRPRDKSDQGIQPSLSPPGR
jgi:hypothetical protein